MINIKKLFKFNLIILIVLVFAFTPVFQVLAEESEEEIVEEENVEEGSEEGEGEPDEELTEMDQLEIEKSSYLEKYEESNEIISIIQEEVSESVAEMAKLNQEVLQKEREIQTLRKRQEMLREQIEINEEKLQESEDRYIAQKELLERRLVAMYEIGDASYLEFLLSAKSISNFLSNYYMITEVISTDNQLMETVEYEKQYNKKIRDALDLEKTNLSANEENIEKTQIALNNSVLLKNKRIEQLSEEERGLNEAIIEYQEAINEIETEIRLLALANISEEYVGGVMAWPVPGYTRITSQFGMRTHPITGVYKLHTGTDIGAPYGAEFIAANDGLVVKAAYNRAYGNMVILDHGGGVQTLYAHGSEILVQEGDVVLQGTPVLKVGSTGYSTGAHAHFEVRINGEYKNPLEYITSYNKSNTVEEVIIDN